MFAHLVFQAKSVGYGDIGIIECGVDLFDSRGIEGFPRSGYTLPIVGKFYPEAQQALSDRRRIQSVGNASERRRNGLTVALSLLM